jgi:mannose-6-phosphate isomerase-like protein (cupin superfamily)
VDGGFVVRAGEDRFAAPIRFLNGRFDIKVSGRDTDGRLCVIDTVRIAPGGPPVHVHEAQDEVFQVLDGRFRFRIGDELFEAGPGDVVFGPRHVPHAFASVSPTARLLLTFQPALTIETFFAEGGLDPLSEEFARVSRAHGMELIAPPLDLD